MVDRTIQLAESLREVARLGRQPVSEVTPSRRDFTQYVATQRQGLAVVARVGRRAAASADALLAHARACDDAEVAALAVATSSAELSLQDMAAIAAATSAPILREALILDRSQLYASRLHGADAVILAAPELGAAALRELVAVTGSMHMAPVIEVLTEADVDAALDIVHAIIGLRRVRRDGSLDLDGTLQLAARVPKQRTVVVLPEVFSPAEGAALAGHCDAIVIGEGLVGAPDIAAALAPFLVS